jgi:DnaJ-class molecular chaperone
VPILKEDFGIQGVWARHSEEMKTTPSEPAMAVQVPASGSMGQSLGQSRCPQCGGSGLLRIDDQRYRTCLDCLGKGRSPTMANEGILFRMVTSRSASSAR